MDDLHASRLCGSRSQKRHLGRTNPRGLSHILIGVERAEDDNLKGLDKRFYAGGVAAEAVRIFKEHYPEVFIQCTFIVGVKNENQDTLKTPSGHGKAIGR